MVRAQKLEKILNSTEYMDELRWFAHYSSTMAAPVRP